MPNHIYFLIKEIGNTPLTKNLKACFSTKQHNYFILCYFLNFFTHVLVCHGCHIKFYHKLGGLNNSNLCIFSLSGAWRSKIKVWAVVPCSEASLTGWQTAVLTWSVLCTYASLVSLCSNHLFL
jgi:hypothetical protein